MSDWRDFLFFLGETMPWGVRVVLGAVGLAWLWCLWILWSDRDVEVVGTERLDSEAPVLAPLELAARERASRDGVRVPESLRRDARPRLARLK